MFVENILESENSSEDVLVLLAKLEDPLPHSRALAYLVLRELLLCTQSSQQVQIATQALAAMHLRTLDSLEMSEDDADLQKVQFTCRFILNHLLMLFTL